MNDSTTDDEVVGNDVSTKEYVNELFDSSSPEKSEAVVVEEYDPEVSKEPEKPPTQKKKTAKKKPAKKKQKRKQPEAEVEAESKTTVGGGGKTKKAGDGWGVGTMVSAYWPGTKSFYDGQIMKVNEEDETCVVKFEDGDVNDKCPWSKLRIL